MVSTPPPMGPIVHPAHSTGTLGQLTCRDGCHHALAARFGLIVLWCGLPFEIRSSGGTWRRSIRTAAIAG